ncbi:MBL fold metallo-hydrolase [Paenibacillus campinasensis]|uniref:MBL fold metallo-hydrolase n=1 Tax=Paenibacillus campinasensis TaxID=66347 RepID=A0A268EJZ1_9BACL|nr:MBL fold metallo-hydrolase [Paenibacillus campinasensis]MUG67320.1 MBL fold metallo-hydrolase [Paenibacillus campinasensis]PAD73429.1 Zn-dependent hydrolase [Paenibacillus campinasensis]
MMKLKVWGGAGEHGRSAYVLSGSDIHLLLDCGVKREGAGEYPLIEPELVLKLNAVFLSHAHEDHSVAIPMLYRLGYQGEVWTTRETAAQVESYFESWRAFTERSGGPLPYEEADYKAIRYRFLDEAAARLTWFEVVPGVEAMWGRSGHMAGSVWLLIRAEGKEIFYSGDYTAESMLLEDDSPRGVRKEAIYADLAIIDAAYGTDAESQNDKLELLEKTIRSTLDQGGKVLLPVPATGRGQEMLLWAYRTYRDTPIVIERGLLNGMERLLSSPEWLRERDGYTGRDMKAQVERFLRREDLLVPGHEDDRIRLLDTLGASIWFITDGMMQSELARWYYEQLREDPRHLVLLTGHASKGTFAERLLRQPSAYGVCAVKKLKYKVHQGCEDVRRMMSAMPARHNVLVHAVKEETDRLRSRLLEEVEAAHDQVQIHSMSASEELWF